MALAEIGCGHQTISAKLLSVLSTTPDTLPPPSILKPVHHYAEYTIPARLLESSRLDPLAPVDWNGKWASASTDYLANNAVNLDKAILTDEQTVRRLREATDFFLAAEAQVTEAIQEELFGKTVSEGATTAP